MKIGEGIYLVGSGKYGFEMTDSMDCNVYLIDGKDECALIDAGGGVEPERIVRRIEACGFSMSQVRYCLLTHVHADHAAGARYFRDRYDIRIAAAAEAAPWLEQGDMAKTSLEQAKQGGVYPPDFQYPACPVDMPLAAGDLLSVGGVKLQVVHSPGHSRGHICYLWDGGPGDRKLFAGDAVFAGGKVVVQRIWDCIIEEYAATVDTLNGLRIDRLFPGHGPFLLSGAYRHIESAHRSFSRLELPPNL